jgi:hypothetical protein
MFAFGLIIANKYKAYFQRTVLAFKFENKYLPKEQ